MATRPPAQQWPPRRGGGPGHAGLLVAQGRYTWTGQKRQLYEQRGQHRQQLAAQPWKYRKAKEGKFGLRKKVERVGEIESNLRMERREDLVPLVDDGLGLRQTALVV